MQALSYTLVPLLALVIGAFATTFGEPGPRLRSGIQHLAAGVVFAAAASEILPDVQHGGPLLAIVIGALAGIAAMLAIKAVGTRMQAR